MAYMPKLTALQGGKSLRTCVKYSDASRGHSSHDVIVATNPGHEMHLVQMLCVHYGWSFGVDLELLPPKSFYATDEGLSA